MYTTFLSRYAARSIFAGDHAHRAHRSMRSARRTRAATSGPGLGLRRLALGRSGLAGAGAAPLEAKCYTKEGRPGRRPPH